MAENKWEVVTKSKKAKNLEKKIEAHLEKKRLDSQLPKLEEILPPQSLPMGRKSKIERSRASSASSSGKLPKNTDKTSANKQLEPEVSKLQQVQDEPTSTKPKRLEVALNQISIEDFDSELDQLQTSYPGSELMWCKGIATFFNSALQYDVDPTFAGKSVNYPTNLLSRALRTHLTKFLESMGQTNLVYFYHSMLVSTILDMSAKLPVVGYRLLLQLIGKNWPQVCSANMAKTAVLRNSYQNRTNIGLTILWAIGQGGYKDMEDGIRVWQNLMLPVLGQKPYSKFVAQHIWNIVSTSKAKKLTMNQNEFFRIFTTLRSSDMSKEVQLLLNKTAEMLLRLFINSSSKKSNIFLMLLREINDFQKHRIELDGCIQCLLCSDDSFKTWETHYDQQMLQSKLLLKRIATGTDDYVAQLVDSPPFMAFLRNIKIINMNLRKRFESDDTILDDIMSHVQSIQEKPGAQQKRNKQNAGNQKKKCGCCRWVLGSIFLIALIGGVLAYDTHVNGKGVFERSATGKLLKQAGLLPYVEKAWYTSMSASARGYKWAEKHVPPYAKPAGKLACDLFKLSRNAACNAFSALCDFANAKLPVAAKFLEQYVPGLPKQIENTSVTVKSAVVDISGKIVAFFKSQVLVGRLSPDNLSKALNQTQNIALEYLNLFHKKVDAYAKLK